MTSFVVIDISNLVHRAKHVIKHYDTFDECVGMVLTIVFNSLKKSYDRFGAQHCVACFDSWSWRKDFYPDWKGDRDDYSTLAPSKKEEYDIIHTVIKDVRDFFITNTNVTVLYQEGIEADDFVARWVQIHNDERFSHVIVSSDNDFKQLVRKNVDLFDPIRSTLFTLDGIFFDDGKPIGRKVKTYVKYGQTWKVKLNKKSGEPEVLDPEWEIFKACIRGVKNNTKSAYPRVYETKMRKAFNDKGGLEWNNFINTEWGPEGSRQSVRERYELNKSLLDLRYQPDEIIDQIDETICIALSKGLKQMVGVHFKQFCGKYELINLAKYSQPIINLLSNPYDG